MTTECEISPQALGEHNGLTLEHDSPLSSPDSEQPNKGNTVRSDDSGIGMDDSHTFSMDQSAMSDDLNATTPEEDKVPSSPSLESPTSELAENGSENKGIEGEIQNGTETEAITEISQPSEPQEETQSQVTEEVSSVCVQHTETIPNGDLKSESEARPEDISEIQNSSETQSSSQVTSTVTVTEKGADGAEVTTTKTVVTRTEVVEGEPQTLVTKTEVTEGEPQTTSEGEPQVTTEGEPQTTEPAEVSEESIVPKSEQTEESAPTDACEVKITVTEAEEPPAEEEVVPEPEPEPEPEEERVDFVRAHHDGTTCNDVTTALEILKTRYRLSDVHVKKCIITWSCWNLPDLVVKRPLSDWRGSPNEVPDLPENEALKVLENLSVEDLSGMVEHINTKEDEIDKLVKEVLKADEEKKTQAKPTNAKPALEPVQEEAITVEQAPPRESAPPSGEEPKKKKRNVFSRMIHALRKRLSGKRSRA